MEATSKFDCRSLAALAIFASTGTGLVMPGTLLPLLLTRWSMSDERAGALLFCSFVGSMFGAVLSRGSMRASVVRGCVLTALAGLALSMASAVTAYASMLFYGMGLGITMTSISLLQSRNFAATRATQMARLNFVWSVGAIASPLVLLRSASVFGVKSVLMAVALMFLAGAVLAAVLLREVGSAVEPASVPSGGKRISWLLLAMVPLATGVESAVGSWLTTYSKRASGSLGSAAAATCLWVGMLLTRMLQSAPRVGEALNRRWLRIAPAVIALSIALIIAFRQGWSIAAGALLIGLAIGPVYPLLLALVLHRGEGKNAVFIIAGCGSSLFPLLTGVVSGWRGSLIEGLCVPLAAACTMAVCGWFSEKAAS